MDKLEINKSICNADNINMRNVNTNIIDKETFYLFRDLIHMIWDNVNKEEL